MPKRNANSPWGSAYKEGLPTTAVNDTIDINQELYPSVDTWFIDVKTGKWNGIVASDEQFDIMQLDEGVANGASFLTPSTNPDGTWPLDMTGYSDLFIAINPSAGGAYALKAVYGPATVPFHNLTPIDAANEIRGNVRGSSGTDFGDIILDSSETLTVDVWNIFYIQDKLENQAVLQFSITNNTGSASNVQTAFMRMV